MTASQLQTDLHRINARRRALGRLAAAGWAGLGADAWAQACVAIPRSTAGPFPGDGSIPGQGRVANALALVGIMRRDISASVGGGAAVAQGVALELALRLTDADCRPLPGAAIYVWQCDREGRYSMYSPGVEDQDYLRGVQVADAQGLVQFRSVFPGAYPGRWPHVHFETFRSLADAGTHARRLKVSQFALPRAACEAAYAAPGYGDSASALKRMRLERDGIFRGDAAQWLAPTSGSVQTGFVARLDLVATA